MSDHKCFFDSCLYCMTKALYDHIEKLNADRMQLTVENLYFKRKLEDMDKQIKKITSKEKSVLKDTKKLLKMDKVKDKEEAHDKKMAEKCDMKMKKKK